MRSRARRAACKAPDSTTPESRASDVHTFTFDKVHSASPGPDPSGGRKVERIAERLLGIGRYWNPTRSVLKDSLTRYLGSL